MNFFAYGCIYGHIPTHGIETSKVYHDLVKKIRSHFIPEDAIHIDVLINDMSRRRELEWIITSILGDLSTLLQNPRGIIFVSSIFDLGKAPDEIRNNFDRIATSNIGLLIGDNDSLSTVDYAFEYYDNIVERIQGIQKKIELLTFEKRKTGIIGQSYEITDEFIEVYWLFEHYFISEKLTLDNPLTGKMPKSRFYNLCRKYEESERYALDEEARFRDMPEIIEKPKRFGPVPEDFEQGNHPNHMTDITLQRMRVKKEGGRKAMIKACKNFNRDYDPFIRHLLRFED